MPRAQPRRRDGTKATNGRGIVRRCMTRAILTQAFRAQVASGATDPVYLIIGDDDHEKSALALALGEMVEADLRAFNVERLYAVDTAVTPSTVAEAARTLPMIAPRRVVVVLQAEKLLAPRKKRGADAGRRPGQTGGSLEPLLDYLADPRRRRPWRSCSRARRAASARPTCRWRGTSRSPRRWSRPRRWSCARGSTAARIRVVDRAAGDGRRARDGPSGRRALLQVSGGDVGRLRADVEKLLLFAAGRAVTLDHVAAVVGAPAHHGDDWALVAHRAGRRRRRRCANCRRRWTGAAACRFRFSDRLATAVRTPPPRGRFPARRVPAAVDALLRTDLALKSSGGDPRVLLERLVVELCG